MKATLEDFFLKTMLVFPISTVLVDNGITNKCLFAILFLFLVFFENNIKMKKEMILIFMFSIMVYLSSLFYTEYSTLNINLIFYFPFLVIYTHYIIKKKNSVLNWLKKHKQYIDIILNIWTFIVGISIFIPSCYYVKEGGSLYFGSFVGTIFRLGPAAFFIQTIALVGMSLFSNKNYLFYMIVPVYCFLMGSSRTYFFIGACLFVIALYWFVPNKKTFICTTILLGFLVIIILMQSSLGTKIMYTLDPNQYGDFWYRISSSRSLFWAEDIISWSKQPLLNMALGCGLDFTYRVSGLWAHNDFIEITCSLGFVGLFLYLWIFVSLLKNLLNTKRKIPLIIKFAVIFAWLFNAFFNMHYTYFCCVLGYPLALLAIHQKYCDNFRRRCDITK